MTTFYVDYENGNDSNNGTSFATRKKTVASAATAAVNGDEIRVMASPEPTLVGDGTVTSRPGYDTALRITSSTYSTIPGESVFTTSTTHGFSNGDTVHLFTAGGTVSQTYYSSGTWEITVVDSIRFKLNGYTSTINTTSTSTRYVYNITQRRILLSTPVTQNIASYGPRTTSWIGSTFVTTTLVENSSTTSSSRVYTEHIFSDQFAISSVFTTGKAAYYTLPSTLDLSGYQQISFRLQYISGNSFTSGNFNCSLRLCSDSSGNTTVNTINIPSSLSIPSGSSTEFIPITVDLGTNLGSNINSIALYVNTDVSTQTIRLSNIIACKASSSADSLTLNSLIGRNTTNNDSRKEWYAIESINGTRVILDCGSQNYNMNSVYNAGHACWFGDTDGTYPFYKIQPISTSSTGTSVTDATVAVSQTSKFDIILSGGWNRTDMSTQTTTAMTFLDGMNCYGYGLYLNSDRLNASNLGLVRYNLAVYNQRRSALENIMMISTSGYALYASSLGIFTKFKNIQVHSAGDRGRAMYFLQSSTYSIGQEIIPDTAETDIVCSGTVGTAIDIVPTGGITENRKVYMGDVRVYYCGTYSTLSSGVIRCGKSSWVTFNNLNLFPGCPLTSNAVGIYNESIKNPVRISSYNSGKYWIAMRLTQASTIIIDTVSIDNNTGFYYGNSSSDRKALDSFGKAEAYILGGSINTKIVLDWETSVYLDNVTYNPDITYFTIASNHGALYSKNHNGVSGDYYNIVNLLSIRKETTIRHTSSGFSWRIIPELYAPQSYDPIPYEFPIAKVSAKSGVTITLKIWVYRQFTGSIIGLRVNGLGIAGVNDTTSVVSGPLQTWEQLSVSVTPTENCILDADIFVTSGTTTAPTGYMYIDDFTVE